MQTMRVLEGVDVIESLLAGLVGHMEAYAPIHADDKHAHVVANTHTRAYSHLLEELPKLELSLRTMLFAAKGPHVTGIQE